jgi:hypothetical protein
LDGIHRAGSRPAPHLWRLRAGGRCAMTWTRAEAVGVDGEQSRVSPTEAATTADGCTRWPQASSPKPLDLDPERDERDGFTADSPLDSEIMWKRSSSSELAGRRAPLGPPRILDDELDLLATRPIGAVVGCIFLETRRRRASSRSSAG